MPENNLIIAEIIFLEFNHCKNYNTKKSKKFKKVAVEMERGRPKLEIQRSERLNLRLSKFELEKISKIAEKKNISRTEAILQRIDLLIHYKPKRIASRSGKKF